MELSFSNLTDKDLRNLQSLKSVRNTQSGRSRIQTKLYLWRKGEEVKKLPYGNIYKGRPRFGRIVVFDRSVNLNTVRYSKILDIRKSKKSVDVFCECRLYGSEVNDKTQFLIFDRSRILASRPLCYRGP